MEQQHNPYYLFVFIILVLSLEAVLFSFDNFKLEKKNLADENRIKLVQNILSHLSIEAKAFSVYDVAHNKKIYSKNDEVALPLASITKVMTVVVAMTNRAPDEVLAISKDALKQYGEFGLFLNEKWRMNDLAKLTLISSANDGAYVLASTNENFLTQMNTKAKRLGMQNTSFFNFTGLDLTDGDVGALATAGDVNLMTIYALRAYPEIFQVTTLPEINITSLSGFNHTFKNTDTTVDKIPNLLFSKTGFTSSAGGNLAIIFKNKNGDEIAVTVLGSTFLGRFSDMEKIVNILYSN